MNFVLNFAGGYAISRQNIGQHRCVFILELLLDEYAAHTNNQEIFFVLEETSTLEPRHIAAVRNAQLDFSQHSLP